MINFLVYIVIILTIVAIRYIISVYELASSFKRKKKVEAPTSKID